MVISKSIVLMLIKIFFFLDSCFLSAWLHLSLYYLMNYCMLRLVWGIGVELLLDSRMIGAPLLRMWVVFFLFILCLASLFVCDKIINKVCIMLMLKCVKRLHGSMCSPVDGLNSQFQEAVINLVPKKAVQRKVVPTLRTLNLRTLFLKECIFPIGELCGHILYPMSRYLLHSCHKVSPAIY